MSFHLHFSYSFSNNKAKKITQYQKSQRIKSESYCIPYVSYNDALRLNCVTLSASVHEHSSLTKPYSPKEIIWYCISLRNHIVIVAEYDHFLFFVDLFVQTCGYKNTPSNKQLTPSSGLQQGKTQNKDSILWRKL